MLKLRCLVRIVLWVAWLLHQNGRTISMVAVAVTENTTSQAGPTNTARSQPTEAMYESVDAPPATTSSGPRRPTPLSRVSTKTEPPPSGHYAATHRYGSNFSYDSSSIASTNEDVVSIGGAKRSSGNSTKTVDKSSPEFGFQPFVPKPAIDVLAPKFDLNDVYFSEFDGAGSTWTLPRKTEYSDASDSRDYPTYSDVPSKGSFDASFSKYYDSKDYANSFYTSTFDPPVKISPTNVYGEHQQAPVAFSVHKNHQRKPHEGYVHENSWENSVSYWPADQNFVDAFTSQKDSLDGTGYDFSKAAYIKNKLRIKSSLLRILTTLIPFGLLLSALPPKVVIINSTSSARPESARPEGARPESIHQKGYVRNLDQELLPLNNLSLNDTLDHATQIEHSETDLLCTKRKICEAALLETNPSSSSAEDYSLWHALSRSSNSTAIDSDVQDILEAVAQKRCSKFTCEETSSSTQFPHERRED